MAQALLATIVLAFVLNAGSTALAADLPELRVPAWSQLDTTQQMILAPLKSDWDEFDDPQRRKWLGIAKRYPTMPEQERLRVQQRMRDWAKLTPDQRRQARRQYRNLQNIAPDQREALKQRWQEYESLPEAERQRLKESAAKPPPRKPGSGPTAARPAVPPAAGPAALRPDPPKPAAAAAPPSADSASPGDAPPAPARAEPAATLPDRPVSLRP